MSVDYDNACLIIRSPSTPPRSLPMSQISQLICMHNTKLSTQVIGQLHKRGIDLIVINQRYANHSFSLFADQQRQVAHRCHQYNWQQSPTKRLPLAKAICRHKFLVSRRVLPHNNSLALNNDITVALNALADCGNDASLRGIEGALQRKLFAYWRTQLPTKLGFNLRQRRPPPDPVNALLSFTYTFGHNEAVRQSKRYGLDPQLGFYHAVAGGRESLACDLIEPVRPEIEAWVVFLFKHLVLRKTHFSFNQGTCLLNKEGRQIFYQHYAAIHPQWRKHIQANARWLIKQFTREEHTDG